MVGFVSQDKVGLTKWYPKSVNRKCHSCIPGGLLSPEFLAVDLPLVVLLTM